MSAWKPTDEQIEMWAADTNGSNWATLHPLVRENELRVLTDLTTLPAFQSIIRAAQAEAYDHGVETGIGRALAAPSAVSAGRQVADVSNPYKDAS